MSLSELKKMQKDVAKAISTFEDRQKAEARAKVEALARDLGYSLAELVGTLRTRRSPGPPGRANRNGSWTHWRRGRPRATWLPVEGLTYAIGRFLPVVLGLRSR
jgi:DNA-binding protein H-NS